MKSFPDIKKIHLKLKAKIPQYKGMGKMYSIL